MLRSVALALAAAGAAVAAPGAAAQQQPSGLAVRAVRFWRPDTKQTRVWAFVQVPYANLDPAGDSLAYQVQVRVADSSGLTLISNNWSTHVPATVKQDGTAEGLEMLEFVIAPGTYRLAVTVRDSASGRQTSSSADVVGFASAPGASDLLLSPAMRLADSTDTIPRAGELRRGNTLIAGAARLRLTPSRTTAYYFLEAYPSDGTAGEGTVAVTVVDTTGRRIVGTPPAKVTVPAGGGVLRGQLNLDGLPPGSYEFIMNVALGGRTVERRTEFVMSDLAPSLARDAARIAAERVTDEGFFGSLPPEQLDDFEAPLIYLANSGELRAYTKDMSIAAKRRFLANFWQSRDPNKATPRNEMREAFYDRIAYANRVFKESGRGQMPGWKSVRGRIYARLGVPDDSLARMQEGRAPRYTVWRYTTGRARYYIFADRTGVGNWVLLTTNDLKENSLPGWESILTPEGVQDVGRYLGGDFMVTNQPTNQQ